MKTTPDNTYLNLKIGAKNRMLHLTRKNPEWKKAREWNFKNWRAAYCAGLNQGFNDTDNHKSPVWYCHVGGQFRNEKFAHEILKSNHTGWYTNEDGETYRDGSGLALGIVGSLTHGRYIAGYHWGDNNERVYFGDIYEDEDEAARAADEHARIFAELQQEDNAKFNAAKQIEYEIEDEKLEICKLFEIRNIAGKHWGKHPRELLREALQKVRDYRETLRTQYSDYV